MEQEVTLPLWNTPARMIWFKGVELKLSSGLREVRLCDIFFLGSDSCKRKHVYSAWRCYGQVPLELAAVRVLRFHLEVAAGAVTSVRLLFYLSKKEIHCLRF